MIRGQASNQEIGVASAIMIVLVLYLYLSTPHAPITIGQTPNECEFRGNLSCHQQPILRRNGSKLEIVIEQNTGMLINITSLVCTSKSGVPVMPLLNHTVLLTTGERAYVSGGNSGNTVICTGQDGRSIPNESAGDVYDGNMYLAYTEFKTSAVRLVNGTLVVKYS